MSRCLTRVGSRGSGWTAENGEILKGTDGVEVGADDLARPSAGAAVTATGPEVTGVTPPPQARFYDRAQCYCNAIGAGVRRFTIVPSPS